mgnify:CR=1 FL=1
MKTQEVQFGGNNYPCRVVESNEGEELLIGLRLTDVELVAELKKDNPEWFE